EVIDEELRLPTEEVGQGGLPFVGVESVDLVDPDPRQLLPSPRDLVAAPREVLLRLEQGESRVQPILASSGLVRRHDVYPPFGCSCACPGASVSLAHGIHLAPGLDGMGVTSVTGFRWTR